MLKLIVDNTGEPLTLKPRDRETIEELQHRLLLRLMQPHHYAADALRNLPDGDYPDLHIRLRPDTE